MVEYDKKDLESNKKFDLDALFTYDRQSNLHKLRLALTDLLCLFCIIALLIFYNLPNNESNPFVSPPRCAWQ